MLVLVHCWLTILHSSWKNSTDVPLYTLLHWCSLSHLPLSPWTDLNSILPSLLWTWLLPNLTVDSLFPNLGDPFFKSLSLDLSTPSDQLNVPLNSKCLVSLTPHSYHSHQSSNSLASTPLTTMRWCFPAFCNSVLSSHNPVTLNKLILLFTCHLLPARPCLWPKSFSWAPKVT